MARFEIALAVALIALAVSIPVQAASISDCIQIAADQARLRCYDAASGFQAPLGKPSQEWSGSGTTTTEPFTMPGPWRLSWDTDGSTRFDILPTSQDQMPTMATTGDSGGKGSTYEAAGGSFTLTISGMGNSWHAWATPLATTATGPDDQASGLSNDPAPQLPDDIMATDSTEGLPSCSDTRAEDALKQVVSNSWAGKQTGLAILSVDSVSTKKSKSGRDICVAKTMTSAGPVAFDFQWIAHNGKIYMYEKPEF